MPSRVDLIGLLCFFSPLYLHQHFFGTHTESSQELPNANSALGINPSPFMWLIYHEITREQATPSHETDCCSTVQLLLSLWKWGAMYKKAVFPKWLVWNFCLTPWIKAESRHLTSSGLHLKINRDVVQRQILQKLCHCLNIMDLTVSSQKWRFTGSTLWVA